MNSKILGWIVSTSQSFIFSFPITRVKMTDNYAVVLLYFIIIFVLIMLLIIAFLCLLMWRNYYTEITQMQPHRRSLRHSRKRITGFKRSNMSGEDTTTNNVVGNPVWKFMLRMNYITSRYLHHAPYEHILMKNNCSPSYCYIIYNFNTHIDFSHLLLSNSSTAHIWIVTYWEILEQRWIDKDQCLEIINGQEKDKVGTKKTIWKKLWRLQMKTKRISLHFSSLPLWLKKNSAQNNLGPTTFHGQQIYVLYAPFSFLSY